MTSDKDAMTGPLANVSVNFVDSIDSAVTMLRWVETIPTDNVLGFDTETTGLSPYASGYCAVRLVQIASGDVGWAIPSEKWSGVVENVFSSWRGDLVGHNSKFDANWLRVKMDIDVFDRDGVVHDTMLFSHLIHPFQAHGLKPLSDRYVQKGASAGQKLLEDAMQAQNWTWASVPVDFKFYWAYGALDAVITVKLFEAFRIQFPEVFVSKSYQIETAVLPCFASMERIGMGCDMEYIDRKASEIQEYTAWADGWLQEHFSIKNRQSNAQVAKALIEHGAQLTAKTGTGLWQLNKDILKSVQEPPQAAAIAEMVLKTRKMTKLRSSFFLNLGQTNHPNIRQCGASTGRSSVTDPALQTIPRGPMVRTAFLPQPGHLIVTSDLDQVEPRVAANISGDLAFQAAIMSGDLYTTAARVVYRDDTIQKDSPYRTLMKVGILARLYGAQAPGLSEQLGIPLEDAQEFLVGFALAYPTLDMYVKDLIRQCDINGGWVQSVFGRKQRVEYPGSDSFKVMNYMMQGTAAEILKLNVIALDAAGYGPSMLMVIHDEVVLSIPALEAEGAREEIERCMTFRGDEFGWVVPCTASSDIGVNWGHKYQPDPVVRSRIWDQWWDDVGHATGLGRDDFERMRSEN